MSERPQHTQYGTGISPHSAARKEAFGWKGETYQGEEKLEIKLADFKRWETTKILYHIPPYVHIYHIFLPTRVCNSLPLTLDEHFYGWCVLLTPHDLARYLGAGGT